MIDGGGSGAPIRAILSRHANACGVLYELPSVVAEASSVLNTSGLRERCRVIGGDFFRAIPAGGTTYLLCWILHDWPDEAAVTTLRRVRAAMAPGARLIAVARLLDANPTRCDAYHLLHEPNMLMLFNGRERGEAEFNAFMAEVGLAAVRPILV